MGGSGHFLVSHSISLRPGVFFLISVRRASRVWSHRISGGLGGDETGEGPGPRPGPTMNGRYAGTHIREGNEYSGFQRREIVGRMETDSAGDGKASGSVCAPGLGGRGECGDGAKE